MSVKMLQTQCSYGDTDGLEFALDGRMYELDYQIVDGDVDLPEYAFQGTDMTSQGTVQNTVNGTTQSRFRCMFASSQMHLASAPTCICGSSDPSDQKSFFLLFTMTSFLCEAML